MITDRSHTIAVFLAAATVVAGGAAGATPPQQAAQEQSQVAQPRASLAEGYKIGARDVLEISVFDLDQLDTSVRVAENGTISLPLIGDIQASGLTRASLEQEIERVLARYVTEPQVSVFIREYQSQRIAVIGAVHQPGTFEMVGRMRLLEAISDAGGINFNESAGSVTILRATLTGAPLEIDLNNLLLRGDAALNIDLLAGDTVNVVSKDRYFIYVYGQVRNAGSYDLRDPVTLLQAVSLAGGLADRAAANKIVILRRKPDGTQERLQVNLQEIIEGKRPDFPISANDVIIVQETFF